MAKVLGIGGVFFKAADKKSTTDWYKKHLGMAIGEDGSSTFTALDEKRQKVYTVWASFAKESNYFDPAPAEFMINYRVDNLEEMLAQLLEKGVKQIGQVEEFEYGKFAWILDNEGRKLELWQPVDGYEF